jgi:hypothetical protein
MLEGAGKDGSGGWIQGFVGQVTLEEEELQIMRLFGTVSSPNIRRSLLLPDLPEKLYHAGKLLVRGVIALSNHPITQQVKVVSPG